MTDGNGCADDCTYSNEAAVVIEIEGLDDKPFINNNAVGANADVYEDTWTAPVIPSLVIPVSVRDDDSPNLEWAVITPPDFGQVSIEQGVGDPTTSRVSPLTSATFPTPITRVPMTLVPTFRIQVWDEAESLRSELFRIDINVIRSMTIPDTSQG